MDDYFAIRVENIKFVLLKYLSEKAVDSILQELEPAAVSMRDEDAEISAEITETAQEIASALTRIAKKFSQVSLEPDSENGQEELVLRLNSLFEILKVPKEDRDALAKLAGKTTANKKLLQTLSANMTALRILKQELASIKQLKADYEEAVEDRARDLLGYSMEGVEDDFLLALLQKLHNLGLLNISEYPTSTTALKHADVLALLDVFELITV